jgi:predicted Zn-dependent protease
MPAQFAVEVRKQVTEADYLGLQYLYQAGYAAQAAITFLQKLQAIQPATSNARVFNSEPPLAQRIAAIQKNIELLLPPRAQDVENTSEFNSIKAQLRR